MRQSAHLTGTESDAVLAYFGTMLSPTNALSKLFKSFHGGRMMDHRENMSFRAASIQGWLKWIWLSTCVNLAWEILHYPFYAVSSTHVGGIPILAILHCTLGDALISAIAYLATSMVLRNLSWPLTNPWRGLLVFLLLSVVYTAFSEWNNTTVLGNWNYAPTMPQIWGIGISPLLQWVVVPTITLWLHTMKVNPK